MSDNRLIQGLFSLNQIDFVTLERAKREIESCLIKVDSIETSVSPE